MTKVPFVLAATLIGGLTFGAGSASAAPMSVNSLQTGQPDITQVRMMHGDHMMKKRMMRKRMMKRRMMHRM